MTTTKQQKQKVKQERRKINKMGDEAQFHKSLEQLRKHQSNNFKQEFNQDKANDLKGKLKVVIIPGINNRLSIHSINNIQ